MARCNGQARADPGEAMTDDDLKRRAQKDAILIAMEAKKIGLKQAQAQLRDLGYAQWEIDLFTDGDTGEFEDA